MDRHRSAGLRHHGRGLQSRHHQEARPQPVRHQLSGAIRAASATSRLVVRCAGGASRTLAAILRSLMDTGSSAIADDDTFELLGALPIETHIPGHAPHRHHLEHQFGAAAHQSGRQFHQGGAAGRAVPAGDQVPGRRFPRKRFKRLGYAHFALNGQKGYHGVAIVSRLPFDPSTSRFLRQDRLPAHRRGDRRARRAARSDDGA